MGGLVSDRRMRERILVNPNGQGKFWIQTPFGEFRVENLSLDGLLFICPFAYDTSEPFAFTLLYKGGQTGRIQGMARVVRYFSEHDLGCLACRFESLPRSGIDPLAVWLTEFLHQDIYQQA